ncbi:hypothetical protein L3X38_028321 [Prunus dulcis]|uniref:Uncharacterized protein n=1 Tax=Prunus dulcis TaxID=3755 RepID=A0AAD4VR41_PRUDU|nr:hypothetical protein L3X38_028321 [Prunus dulcis]
MADLALLQPGISGDESSIAFALHRHFEGSSRFQNQGPQHLFCDASISFADLRCQLPDEGVQNVDASDDCKKNEDEDDFSPDGLPISTDDIF